jgi:hypothetical protein
MLAVSVARRITAVEMIAIQRESTQSQQASGDHP